MKKVYLNCISAVVQRIRFIYESNISFRDYARNLGADLTYEEGPGIHDWDFWDPYIRRVLDWLPVTGKFVD